MMFNVNESVTETSHIFLELEPIWGGSEGSGAPNKSRVVCSIPIPAFV